MTTEEFKKILEEKGYLYKQKGNRIEVNHRGFVNLESLTTLPEGIVFSNKGSVDLESLITLPEGIVFSNGGGVYLRSLGWFSNWKGNIRGIDSKRLLNKMISLGLFNTK